MARSSSYRRLAQPLLWDKRATLVEPLKVTVARRAVDLEPTGGLAFGDALLYGLYYLGAQIYGVGFHLSMMLGDATSVQAAVEYVLSFTAQYSNSDASEFVQQSPAP
jgi:hypothetical protein